LKAAQITPKGALRQIYVYKSTELEGEIDEVVELIWERGGLA
jgi:hypothetical protein